MVSGDSPVNGMGRGIALNVAATSVPKKDLIVGHSDTFVRAELLVEGIRRPITSVRTPTIAHKQQANLARRVMRSQQRTVSSSEIDTADVIWEDALYLGDIDDATMDKATVRFTLRNQEALIAGFIGEVVIKVKDLISKSSHTLLVHAKNGDPVLLWRSPPTPCELRVSVVAETIPDSLRSRATGLEHSNLGANSEYMFSHELSHEPISPGVRRMSSRLSALMLSRSISRTASSSPCNHGLSSAAKRSSLSMVHVHSAKQDIRASNSHSATWENSISIGSTLSPPSRTYARHVFMMTRGTRGDVQPFVALARGLAR